MPAYRIVAIDYDSQIGERLLAAFAPPEFDCRWFASGIEALAALQHLQPDVIVCDVMLPDIDGRAVLDAVKRSPTLRDVPFLVLSGVRSEATVRAILDAGADAFLLKPFPVSQLVQTIRKVLRETGADAEPIAEPRRSSAAGHGLSAVARAARDASTASTAARAPGGEASGRQRIGFETRDPLLDTPRPEPPVVPSARREALRSTEDAGPQQRETEEDTRPPSRESGKTAGPPRATGEAGPAPPIRLEGRMSSLELGGVRIRIVTEAEQGRALVVRTTVTRDGRELRRVETTLDDESSDQRALKELIDLQHARALDEISPLPTPARRPREEPPLEQQERGAQEVPPALRETASEPDVEKAPPEAVIVEPKPPRRSKRPPGPRKTAKAKTQALPSPTPQEPPPVETAALQPTIEADSVPLARDATPAPELGLALPASEPSLAVPVPEPIPRASKRAWLGAVGAVLLIVLVILLKGSFGTSPAASVPPPTPSEPSRAPEASSSVAVPPVAPSSEQPTAEPAEVPRAGRSSRPSTASQERLVRGRREWAQALYDAGRYAEATAALDELFKLAPADPEGRRLAAQIQRTPRRLTPAGSNEGSASDQAGEPKQPAAEPTPPAAVPDIPARVQEERRRPPAELEASEPEAQKSLEEAQAPSEPQVEPAATGAPPAPVVLAPIVEHKPPLSYPPMALRHKVEGTVQLKALVDEIGVVVDTRILTGPAREDLNEAAVAYVKKWTFRPATKDGEPVKFWLPVRIDFRLPK